MSEGEGGNNNVWKYVGIGCLIAGLLGACGIGSCVVCAGAGVGGIMVAVAAPAEASHAFLREVRTGATGAAYARMSSTYRAAHTEADFAARVAAMPALTTATDATISQRNVNGGTATMSGTLDGATCAMPPCTMEIVLHQEGEAWFIDTVMAAGELL